MPVDPERCEVCELERATNGARWPVDTNVGAERWRLVLHEVMWLRERILVRARREERAIAAQQEKRRAR